MTIEIAILDSLADDFESLAQIEKYLCFLGYEIQAEEIRTVVNRLLEQKLIYVVENIGDDEFVWYGMTEKGKTLWKTQENAGMDMRQEATSPVSNDSANDDNP